MELFKGENILNLAKEFPDDNSCKAYLAQEKWTMGICVLNAAIPKDAKSRL